MTINHEIAKLYCNWKKHKIPIVVDVYSYQAYMAGDSDTIEHKLTESKWVDAKPLVSRKDMKYFKGYSHGLSPTNFERAMKEIE